MKKGATKKEGWSRKEAEKERERGGNTQRERFIIWRRSQNEEEKEEDLWTVKGDGGDTLGDIMNDDVV